MNRVPSPPPVGKRFEKGVSGNPSGFSKEKRDAVRQLAEIAKERTVEAIETVIHLMLHAQAESVRLKAAEVIKRLGLDRRITELFLDSMKRALPPRAWKPRQATTEGFRVHSDLQGAACGLYPNKGNLVIRLKVYDFEHEAVG